MLSINVLLSVATINPHIITLVIIMLICGGFGGYLNYLNNFDTNDTGSDDKSAKKKYILLGIGASFIVPLLLNMIQSSLIDEQGFLPKNNLIFAGFCLIASIFSRRFITTIGEKILEVAKKAEKASKENAQKIESTQAGLSSANERIEDVKLAVDLKNTEKQPRGLADKQSMEFLIELANTYVAKTSVPEYSERLKLKAEIGRKMGELIVRNNLSKVELFENHPSEGMCVAIAYSVQLHPDHESLNILIKISKTVTSLFGKYTILVSYKTLARNSFINKIQAKDIYEIVIKFREKADPPLLRNIGDTLMILKMQNPDLE